MKAIILAAGRGSRLGDITARQPKPLTPLAGKPLLQWQLDALRAAGVDDVSIVSGYCAEALESYGERRIHNPDWSHSNMVRSLLCADAILSAEPTLVCYGDIVYRPATIVALAASSAPLAISYDLDWHALWSARFDNPLSDAESFRQRDGQLLDIGQPASTLADIEGQYMGLLKFTPTGWQEVTSLLENLAPGQIDKLDMTSLLRALLERNTSIQTIPVHGGWVEVDNPSDIALYEQRIATQQNWMHDWRW